MRSRLYVQVVTAIVVLVFAVGIWATGDAVNPAWLRFYSVAVLVITLTLGAWDHWLWRLQTAQRVKLVPRNLNGTWKGTLTSFWVDPATGARPAPKVAFLVVRQTSSHISLVLLTDESSSRSSLASLANDGTGPSLAYMYLNRPDSRVEHRSRMHNGSAFFEVSGRPAHRIRGRYWTDRNSRGELDFDSHHTSHAEDFREASDLFTHS
jgi:hypothetical protein